MPDQTDNHYLDKDFPDRLERLCDILNTYESVNSSHSYSIADWEGPPTVWDSSDGSMGPLDLSEALERAIGYVAKHMLEHKKALAALEFCAGYLFDLSTAFDNGAKFGGFATYQDYLNSPHWKKTRQNALDRAGGRCMLCNADEEVLHVHHRTYDRLGHEEPEDVIVLCATHHAQFHGNGNGK